MLYFSSKINTTDVLRGEIKKFSLVVHFYGKFHYARRTPALINLPLLIDESLYEIIFFHRHKISGKLVKIKIFHLFYIYFRLGSIEFGFI